MQRNYLNITETMNTVDNLGLYPSALNIVPLLLTYKCAYILIFFSKGQERVT